MTIVEWLVIVILFSVYTTIDHKRSLSNTEAWRIFAIMLLAILAFFK